MSNFDLPIISASAKPESTTAQGCADWLRTVPLINVGPRTAGCWVNSRNSTAPMSSPSSGLEDFLETLLEPVLFVQSEHAKKFFQPRSASGQASRARNPAQRDCAVDRAGPGLPALPAIAHRRFTRPACRFGAHMLSASAPCGALRRRCWSTTSAIWTSIRTNGCCSTSSTPLPRTGTLRAIP